MSNPYPRRVILKNIAAYTGSCLKKFFVLVVVSFFLLFTGCQKCSKEPYLSITVTAEISETEMQMTNYCYDVQSNKLKEVAKVQYYSQYPLSVYDKQNDVLYYSYRVHEDNDKYGDQLFCLDLKTNESKQLTSDIFAINDIIPVNDVVYLLAAIKGSPILKPIIYDKATGKLCVLNENDNLEFDKIAYDFQNDTLFVSAYNYDDLYKSIEEVSVLGKYLPPDYYIYYYPKGTDKPQQLIKTERQLIHRMAIYPDGNLYYTLADGLPEDFPNYDSYKYDLRKKDIEPEFSIDSKMLVTEMLYYYNDEMFFLGKDYDGQQKRGVYSYHLKTGEFKLLFYTDKGYINNFSMLWE